MSEELKKVHAIAMTLICPMSHLLMIDPVILSNGRTYERSRLQNFFAIRNAPIHGYTDPFSHELLENPPIMVPHNTMKSSIEQFVNTYENLERPRDIPEQEDEQTKQQKLTIMDWEDILQYCIYYRSNKSEQINREEEYERAYQNAQTLICPLSGQLMLDPVTIGNGKTYDRSEIRNFFMNMHGYYDPLTSASIPPIMIQDITMNTLTKQFVEMYENKQGEEWEPVVHYCEVYKARRIEQAQKVERQERERQAREKKERIEEYRRNRQLFGTGFFTGYPPQTQNQLEEEARRIMVERQNEEEEARREEARLEEARRRREARRSNAVIDMDRQLAEVARRRAELRAATIRTETERDE